MDETEVLVIGAGLAGLRCADVLAAAGRDVLIWEAKSAVGGRIRTDNVDGFRCDRGFQVLNPAYPELRRAVDLAKLKLQPFGAGVVVRREEGSAVWVHPLRAPGRVPAMLASGGISPRDALAVARWAAPALRPKTLKTHTDRDVSLSEALDRAGVRGEVRRVIDRFLAGVLLDTSGESSNAFALLLARMFLLGVPALPAGGMEALPQQLAARVGERIAFNHRAFRIDPDVKEYQVHADGARVRARHVVVATEAVAAAWLTSETAPPMHGVVTDWWATGVPVAGPPMLRVDGRRHPPGPVLNTAVISAAARTYAPPGQHLIAASAVLERDGTVPPENVMREHAADILNSDQRQWRPLVRHVIPNALPAQTPPLSVRRPIRTQAGVWLCGDHRDTASIQGALVSGRRTAEAILAAR
ncbi:MULTISPECIES: FAD-dependent oxidoreductase [unclassified Mycobacterium]|uniref:flavin monoamine oxidase family protein n=1 Tax=unclassified Mycobacterium TaxID=2642494 RepID=UPI002741A1B7|nr:MULTISPECIES: FAD-dependent oxidoreductase [unclassified Mycobacterium]MDP7705102.1 FAD-dependent oxidoreductase [Mycobacterium sp. TY815]MDP7723672.1 FAD-dependent oxidoreductase [Mycobacterium sp. TY814]